MLRPLLTLLTASSLAASSSAAESRSVALVPMSAEGVFLADLRAEEVVVLENGERRELAALERDERTLAAYLVLDTSTGAARTFRTEAYGAVWAFVSHLPPGAQCTLWTTGDHPRKLGTLPRERKDVDKKVGQGFALEGANALMDSVAEAAGALARESGRRRALVVLSGWGAGHTTLTPGDVTARARGASAPVLALMYGEGAGATAGSLRLGDTPRDAANLTIVGPGDHERILSGLAQATGGRFERVPSTLGAERAFETLAAELAGQYRVRYAPAPGTGLRRVEVRIARPGARWRVTVDSP